jgi:hypothetical protein
MWPVVAAMVASTVLSMAAQRKARKAAEDADEERLDNALWYGVEQSKKAEFEATQMEEQAGTAIAVGQRENMEIQRIAKITESRALALSAASGGGASSPTAVRIMSKIAQRGAYEGAVAMYNAEERSRQLRINADAKRYEGQIALQAGARGLQERVDYSSYNLAAGASLIKGATSLYLRYGQGGPNNTTAEAPASSGLSEGTSLDLQ